MTEKVLNQALLDKITKAAVNGTVAAAEKPTNDMSEKAVKESKPEIKAEVIKQVKLDPQLAHITSSEPWYQKRSRWAAIIASIMAVAGPLMQMMGWGDNPITPTMQASIADLLTAGGTLWAGFLAYRAGTASKPLFE